MNEKKRVEAAVPHTRRQLQVEQKLLLALKRLASRSQVWTELDSLPYDLR